ncbi:hypothetical protein BGW80DRAFT_1562513 [Lactifluus volemus]|nr:hypothetical protein BGW80DRAFT_1562513 [Lactifluus volemus]
MSSQSKRKAESEEAVHIKKLRKGDNDDFNDSEDEVYNGSEFDDEDELDPTNIIPVGIRTRGKLSRNGEAAKTPSQVEDNGPESDMAGKGKQKDTPDKYHTRSSQHKSFFEEEGGESEEEEDDDDDDEVTSGDDSEEDEE